MCSVIPPSSIPLRSRSSFAAKRGRLCLLGLVLCVAGMQSGVVVRADEAAKVLLRYKFLPDQLVRYDVSLKDDYKIQVGSDSDTPHSYQKSVKNYLVRAVEADGSAILELTIESAQLEIHQNGETYTYDSRSKELPEDQPVFQAMKKLAGVPHLQLRMSTRGEVSAFVPLVEGNQVPDNPGQVAFDVLLHLPEDPVAVGETWKEDFELKLPIPESSLLKSVKMQRQYKLKQLDGSLATIELQTRVLTIIDGPEEEMQLLRRKPGGTVVLDVERGMLISKSFNQDNEVTGFEMGPSLMSFRQEIRETLSADQTAHAVIPTTK